MTAYRLAEHVAGTVHVDEMLDEMSPEEFRGWMIKDRVEPIGYANQMLGLIAWYVHAYLSQDTTIEADHFMPWTKHRPAPKAQNQQAWKIWKSITGN